MSSKYTVLETAAIEKLCSLIRESHSVADAISDDSIATNSTFSSKYITDLIDTIPIFDGDADTLGGKHASDFLSITGGTINGNLLLEKLDASEVRYELKNANKNISFVIGADGSYGIYEVGRGWLILVDTNGNRYFEGTASGNLPISGGTIKSSSYAPLNLETIGTGMNAMGFFNSNGFMGGLGIEGENPLFINSGESPNIILHTGNIKNYIGSNIPKTTIQFTNTTNWSIPNTNLETFYLVKNGWCFLHVVAHCNVVASDENSTVFTGLPIPPFQVYSTFSGTDNTYEPCQLTIGTGGQMILRGGTVGKDYSFTYTYPVA